MQLTSAMANKIIKKLHDENATLIQSEAKDKTTTYAADETPIESSYSFIATHKKLWENNRKICLLRHAISKFNLETKLNVFGCTDMTIDQALVKMRMLTEDKLRLDRLRQIKPLERRSGMGGVSEFTKRNYDAAEAEKAYAACVDTLSEIQLKLDEANLTIPFEVAIDL